MATLPPTHGAWIQHIQHAHLQTNLWFQDNVLIPQIPDPCKLGWSRLDGKLVPILSKEPMAPEAVVELLKCTCGVSNCAKRCTCKHNNLPCTQLCNCEADENCMNTNRWCSNGTQIGLCDMSYVVCEKLSLLPVL